MIVFGGGAIGHCMSLERGGERVFLLGFSEQQLVWCLNESECGSEGKRVVHLRQIAAARLLGGFERDATPALNTFGGGLREMLFGAAGEHGSDAGSAKFGGLFESVSSCSPNVKRTSLSVMDVIVARWRKPPATMSYCWLACARRTRARWWACSPVSEAVVEEKVSAMKRRRVMTRESVERGRRGVEAGCTEGAWMLAISVRLDARA
jgi:hypothetical protein